MTQSPWEDGASRVPPPQASTQIRNRSVRFVESSSSRAGRRFEPTHEVALHDLVEKLAQTLPTRGGEVVILPEMPSPLGVPDFVALSGGEAWVAARASCGTLPMLSEIDCSVLAALSPRRALSTSSLSRRLEWSEQEVDAVATRLIRDEAALRTRSGALLLNPALRPEGSLVAVEAKLKDWRKAVLQGRSYRTWADNYVVILGPLGEIAQTRARDAIRQDGGGLFTEIGWLARPRSRRASAVRRLQGFEHLFAALDSVPAF